MNNKIAIFLQDNDSIISFLHVNKIAIYEKDVIWTIRQTIPLTPSNPDPPSLRRAVRRCIAQLGDCRILAGSGLGGMAFFEFDRAGFSIFDITEINDDVLDGILDDIRKGDEQTHMKEEIIKSAHPVETAEPGIYYLDLIALQTECPDVSSKTALRDFLASTPFLELRLDCRHLPPWIENGPYAVQTEHFEDHVHAVIYKKVCEGSRPYAKP